MTVKEQELVERLKAISNELYEMSYKAGRAIDSTRYQIANKNIVEAVRQIVEN